MTEYREEMRDFGESLSVEILKQRQDLREVTRKIRPDWDLNSPTLRENWEGDKTQHWPYKTAK